MNLFGLLLRDLDNSITESGDSLGEQSERVGVAEARATMNLQELYEVLVQNLNPQKRLNLVPDSLREGGIRSFYTRLARANVFQLVEAAVTPDRDGEGALVSVTVTGSTSDFGLPASATLVFTEQPSGLVSNGTYISDERWVLEGAPWLGLDDPGFTVAVYDGPVPPAGSVFATVHGTPLTLRLGFPIETPWVLEGTLAEPARVPLFYGMAGGVNIIGGLPPPLNGLAGLDATGGRLVYDPATQSVASVTVELSSGPETFWQLLPELKVDELRLMFTVNDPGSLRDRTFALQLAGQTTIGQGTIELSGSFPDFMVEGRLARGSIAVTDLLELFLPDSAFPLRAGIAPFELRVRPSSGDFAMGGTLTTDWPIEISGKEIFKLTALELQVARTAGAVKSSISANTIIGPTDDPEKQATVLVSASYQGKAEGWRFEGRETRGSVSLGILIREYLGWDIEHEDAIDGLGVIITTGDDSYVFTGKTAEPWEVPFISGLTVSASLRAGYNGEQGNACDMLAAANSSAAIALGHGSGERVKGPFARLETDWTWNKIDIKVWFDYNPQVRSFGITWDFLEATVTGPNSADDYVATLEFADDVTLGSMVETMVSWLTGSRFGLEVPWNFLDSIELNKLALRFTFNENDESRNKVALSVKIGPIDLGFARIDGVDIEYVSGQRKEEDNGVRVTLSGSFPWNIGDNAVGDASSLGPWNAAEPGSAPAPPGNGNKYLDLRLLAMGQHVTVKGIAQADSVQKAIALMRELPDPEPGKLPDVRFDAQSSWLIGADFGVLKLEKERNGEENDTALTLVGEEASPGYFLTMQMVFHDPHLYGLRIALTGEPAKTFKGLDFQIMYRQVSETVGVYQSEIALPDVMRRLTIGAYTITLPVFGIAVYTNGDFMLDAGFPWNEDFSRSLTIEAIVAPGIPLLGSAGLYFGKLSSATTSKVPAVINGTFNPVMAFGFGAQVGFGKSIEAGILKASFSVTVVGILDGVIAKWNPYLITETPVGDRADIQGEYYFWLRGTLGIVGKLYGSVDFAIIKANVSVELKVLVQVTFETYEPTALSVIASVSVSVNIRIDVGLFTISIYFSFSLKLKETFTVGSHGTPPWQLRDGTRQGRLRAPMACRLRAMQGMMGLAPPVVATPAWSNLQKPAQPTALSGYLAPSLTIAGDTARTLSEQQACYVAMLFIDSVKPVNQDAHTSLLKAAGSQPDTSFESLCKQVFRWTVAAILGPMTADEVDQQVVSDGQLESLFEYLSGSATSPTPIPSDAVEAFLASQFLYTVQVPPGDQKKSVDATVFPMPPALELDVPSYGDREGCMYSFADYNAIAPDFVEKLRTYFDDLAVQVERERKPRPQAGPMTFVAGEEPSVADFVFADYFLLIGRQMIQAARDALRDFKYPIQAGQTANTIVQWVNDTGQLNGAYTLHDLFAANPTHVLTANKKLKIGGATCQVVAGNTFDAIAGLSIYRNAFTATALATENAGARILQPGTKVACAGKGEYLIKANDSLESVAGHFNVPLSHLLSRTNTSILSQPGLLRPTVRLVLPDFDLPVERGDTLRSIVTRFGVTFPLLADQTANGDIPDLFEATEEAPNLDVPHLPQFKVAELIAEAQRSLALQHLSSMAARYHLHGMRLPTAGITPKARGMWVKDESGTLKLPPEAGLYALTGQQFPLPDIQGQDSFTITFNRPASLTWLSFGGGNANQLRIEIAPHSLDNERIQVVKAHATANRLETGLTRLGAEPMYTSDPAAYPFTSALIWQSAASVLLPYGTQPDGVPSLRLWKLPQAMLDLPDPARRAVNPRFKFRIGSYDEASGATVETDVTCYGWASIINFTIKKIPPVASSPATKTTYELVGAGGNDIVLMERLLDEVGGNDTVFAGLILGYAPDQNGGAAKGVETAGGENAVTMGIAQVNLSTVTLPPPELSAPLAAVQGSLGLLNKPSEFIRLLWEASITRAGGFYLYYYDAIAKSGLPDRIFNDKGEADVTLIVLYGKPSHEHEQNCLTDFMNAVATGESIDTSNAVVFAKADPPRPKLEIDATAHDTLARIAYRYYTGVADLARDNAERTLAAGKIVVVNGGAYEVPPDGAPPGGQLADIASHFNTTAAAIKDANPRITNWPDPLPLYTAIRLPRIEITIGTGPGGGTLGSIASYYGENLTTLAADNRDTAGLLAAGQKVTVAGGPTVRSATVPPGVEAVEARRPVPPEVPDQPSAANYGEIFLQHTYNMLAYQVLGTADFDESNMGLPVGPTTDQAQPRNVDKVRMPKTLTTEDTWDYKQALPYPKFAKVESRMEADLPDPAQSPYIGVGSLLQVNFAWQDLYGNTLITALSEPTKDDTEPLNRPPMLTGYTDALIGVGQWPSVASGWQVDARDGMAQLQVQLSFDDSRYRGLLSASGSAATTVRAVFTDALDAASATDTNNYRVSSRTNGGSRVEKATLSADGKMIDLAVSALSEGDRYTLTVNNVKSSTGIDTFSGHADFAYPDNAEDAASTLVQQAQQDHRIYTQLWHQLADPNGIAVTIETSLLKGSIALSRSQMHDLVETWLGSIYEFIADRARGRTSVPPPVASHLISHTINPSDLNDHQIFELNLSFTIARIGGAILGDFATTPGVEQASAPVAPLLQQLEPGNGDGPVGLKGFAQCFEDALSQALIYRLKVATGVDRTRLSTTRSGSAIWAVRVGLTNTEGISYRVKNPDQPVIFAPRPISNQLESRLQVPIHEYRTGTGIDFETPGRHLDFVEIDMDVWGRQFFDAIDGILTPEFTSAIQIVALKKNTDYLQQILDQKKALARVVKDWMMPVFRGESADANAVQEAFEQQLLVRMGNAYAVRAGIQFQAEVAANIETGPEAEQPPRLFGNIAQGGESSESGNVPKSEITLTSPKLELKDGSAQPLAFLLTAPDQITGGAGQEVSSLTLQLTYNGSAIEHQIGKLTGIENYAASSWLRFVIPDGTLTESLGERGFTVPLVLRSYPASPIMASQAGKATHPVDTKDLSDVLRWTYCFTYSQPFHYQQDRIHCQVDFNVADAAHPALTGIEDAFPQLAEFITIFPAVKKDLESILATVDAAAVDQETIDNAAIALGSFIQMTANVVQASRGTGFAMGARPEILSTGAEPYAFIIEESAARIDETDALLVTIYGRPPAGIGIPRVLVDPGIFDIQPYTGDCEGDYCYWYKNKTSGKPLAAGDGQTIADREVELPAMNILTRQSAYASVFLKRNERLADKEVAAPFVYTTARVRFANPYHPTIEYSDEIDIAKLGSSNDASVARTLDQQLTVLMVDNVLEDNTQESATLQVDCSYTYSINPALEPVALPVLMQAPLEIDLAEKGGKTVAEMISVWTGGIKLWFTTHRPERDDGTLWFNLGIMSDLTGQPMPLLRFRRLKLPVAYVTDLHE